MSGATGELPSFRPDGKVLAVPDAKGVRLVPLVEGVKETRVTATGQVVWAGDGSRLTVVGRETIRVFHAAGARVATFHAPGDEIVDAVFGEGGREVYSLLRNGTCVVWQLPQ